MEKLEALFEKTSYWADVPIEHLIHDKDDRVLEDQWIKCLAYWRREDAKVGRYPRRVISLFFRLLYPWMPYGVPKLVLQAFSTGYAPLKDMFSYMMDKKEFVKNLEDNLTKLIGELATFYSRKETVDRRLDTAVSEEKSGEYDVLDLPSFEIHDVSSATELMDDVQKRKPTINTRKFFKLATLSKKINELVNEISLVSGKMKPENVLRVKQIEHVQVKYDEDIYLPSSSFWTGDDGVQDLLRRGTFFAFIGVLKIKLRNLRFHVAIDKLPLIPGVLELVGIGYTGYFAYRNLGSKSSRDALIEKIKGTYDDIIGSS
ncbi:hypothetical protein SASPL_145917 [Salvia splendens]|uniref:Cyanobacterial aminoacyl-tRNA synthetase CAAD domain-containing protein n=1 Tax=Salvia splendens TaxID=180675 RepID=A0A8X8WIB9_SALSN|nr:hypothetical protein SASPL_145917 [Salvia splendens]